MLIFSPCYVEDSWEWIKAASEVVQIGQKENFVFQVGSLTLVQAC